MKKQNANNKLTFNKAAVTELNISELSTINGGISFFWLPITSFVIHTGGEDGREIVITRMN
jgi:bacteriocin-like protein